MERVISIVGFNVGIEAMQVIVVCATMPSLLLLSRTRAYSLLRIVGAGFAVTASLGWIEERLLNVHNPVELLVNGAAQHALLLAALLFLISFLSWSWDRFTDAQAGHGRFGPLIALLGNTRGVRALHACYPAGPPFRHSAGGPLYRAANVRLALLRPANRSAVLGLSRRR